MKIAVITYHYSNNKGAVMQTYGLCKFLRDYGYDIELIDIRQKESTTNLLVKIVKFFVVGYRMNKDMKTFYPPLTRRYGSVKELRNDPPKADCYIVGSDQVWNPNISKSLMMAYFLDFGPSSVKRISYASSFGISDWVIKDYSVNQHISKLLNSYSALSVREKEGKALCEKEFHVSPTIVLDPTFLNEDYSEFTVGVKQKKIIVCYKINKTVDFWKNVPKVKEQLGNIPMTILNYNYPKKGFKYCFPPSLDYWMKSIASAKFILTDSFHGVAFSIISKKDFCVILNHNDRDSRLINIVSEFGLQDRMFSSVEEMLKTDMWMKPIDYSNHEPQIKKRVVESQKYLLNALSAISIRMKVLFCSPYSDAPESVKGGINTWGRYIMAYYNQYGRDQVEMIPVSLDRTICVDEKISFVGRLICGFRELVGPVKKAIKQMDSERPRVAHFCTCAGLGLFRDLLLLREAKKRDIKTVVHLHFGRIPELAKKNNWEWKLLSKVLHMCDVPVVMNRPTEKTLVNEGFKNVTYLPNPLGMSVLDAIHSIEGKYGRIPRRLLYCGHVFKSKGVLELVEGCSRIPNIELRIVGKYSQDIKDEMQSIAVKSGQNISWLVFVGEVAHEDVIREFFQADMFVFPSYTEGFPNVILEAMACGCPIVSSGVGAIPEMLDIDGNACGVCFKSRSADEVYSAVSSLIDNQELKSSLAANARVRVNSLYAIPQVWKEMVNIWMK